MYLLSWNDFGTISGVKDLAYKFEADSLFTVVFSLQSTELLCSLLVLLSSSAAVEFEFSFFNRSTSFMTISVLWIGILGRISCCTFLITTFLSTSSWTRYFSWLFFTARKIVQHNLKHTGSDTFFIWSQLTSSHFRTFLIFVGGLINSLNRLVNVCFS